MLNTDWHAESRVNNDKTEMKQMLQRRVLPIQWLVTILLLLFPVVASTVHDAGNAILYLLLLTSLLALALRASPDGIRFGELFRQYWPLHLAMASVCLAVLLNQVWSGNFAFKFYDRGLRLAVFPLIFWVLFFVPLRHIKLLQWSFFVAAIVAAVKAYFVTRGWEIREGNIGFLSIIAYSDIAFLAGVLCLTCRGWSTSKSNWILLLRVFACVAGAFTSILTATRGSWLAVPLWLIFFFVFSDIRPRQKWLWSGALVTAVVLVFSLNQGARDRVRSVQSDLASYSQGEGRSTSTGIRLQLWSAALRLIEREPVFGIGRENYEPSIRQMYERNEVTKDLTSLAHSHNEILFNTVISGSFGLLALLAVYIVPGYYFARELRNESEDVRTAARSGCILVLGFFAFGLTDLMFFWPMLGGYYIITAGVFLAAIVKAKRAQDLPSPVR
ncbi:O-antigen ligase family protein [Herbaspirillum sp. NPDC101396]|uniref:O-antigen ligase family protein n=1 Tax=Herbaspirillum sp. NPDC101396 TaxID=3364005 RepID=UPI00383B7865